LKGALHLNSISPFLIEPLNLFTMQSKTKLFKSGFLKKALIVAAVICVFFACSKSSDTKTINPVDCSGNPKTFSTDVNPITQASCATNSGCHGSGSNNGPGELRTYAEIFNARSAIRSAVSSGAMPKNGSLAATEKNAILCWIDNGAPNN